MSRTFTILLVEDEEGDVELVRAALGVIDPRVELRVAATGAEALAALRREGPNAGLPAPDLVVMDLNLPGMGGRELLRAIKGDAALRGVPVVVLTTSEARAEVAGCYDLGANCYVAKPVEYAEFARVIRAIRDFWVGVAARPS